MIQNETQDILLDISTLLEHTSHSIKNMRILILKKDVYNTQ